MCGGGGCGGGKGDGNGKEVKSWSTYFTYRETTTRDNHRLSENVERFKYEN